jgi:hypothetical protein
MALIIKKHISFEFLGDDYATAYGVFASIPTSQYEEINNTIDKEDKPLEKTKLMLDLVKSKFIEGKFPDNDGKLQPITESDLDGADGELLLTIYNRLMGGLDPKELRSSTNSSTTEESSL